MLSRRQRRIRLRNALRVVLSILVAPFAVLKGI